MKEKMPRWRLTTQLNETGGTENGSNAARKKSNSELFNLLLLHRQEEFKLRRKLFLGVQSITEIYSVQQAMEIRHKIMARKRRKAPADAAVGMDLHAQSLNVVGSVRPPREI